MRTRLPSAARPRPGMARAAAVLTLVLGAALVPASPSGAVTAHPQVTGGQPDGSTHPYVAMVLTPGAVRPSCTGVLVRADTGYSVVLTDAHCFYPGKRYGTGVRVTFASTFSSSAPLLTGTYTIDPQYDATTHAHDVAVIRLARATTIGPARLAPLEMLARVANNSDVDTVGTGHPHPGQRRSATERVTRKTDAWLYLVAGSGNTCGGDSGGPDLLHATATVLALTDEGTCSYDQDTRLEGTAGPRSFIDSEAGLTAARPTLHHGSRGIDVRVVRRLLGVGPGTVFGPRTGAAVRAWQRGHHINPSGVVGYRTWRSFGF